MAFVIKIVPSALKELEGIRVFDRRRIVQAIEQHLTHEPTAPTRNRKMLPDLEPPFDCEPPIWPTFRRSRVGFLGISARLVSQ